MRTGLWLTDLEVPYQAARTLVLAGEAAYRQNPHN